ncbi:uncharacterized protein IWZ02DRAFT_45011 [Phyllosticta citriasiana]|uniref:uncharacterized protein n=1 Tax=Phyllosticta citriasiana TaxID=595635 RepID=UPI0030FDF277
MARHIGARACVQIQSITVYVRIYVCMHVCTSGYTQCRMNTDILLYIAYHSKCSPIGRDIGFPACLNHAELIVWYVQHMYIFCCQRGKQTDRVRVLGESSLSVCLSVCLSCLSGCLGMSATHAGRRRHQPRHPSPLPPHRHGTWVVVPWVRGCQVAQEPALPCRFDGQTDPETAIAAAAAAAALSDGRAYLYRLGTFLRPLCMTIVLSEMSDAGSIINQRFC